jgi:hypothetical protein
MLAGAVVAAPVSLSVLPAGALHTVPLQNSGAYNFWLWGLPPAADSAGVAVKIDPALLRREFTQVRLVGTFWNGLGVSDDEQGVRIFIAPGLKSTWTRSWAAFRDYS